MHCRCQELWRNRWINRRTLNHWCYHNLVQWNKHKCGYRFGFVIRRHPWLWFRSEREQSSAWEEGCFVFIWGSERVAFCSHSFHSGSILFFKFQKGKNRASERSFPCGHWAQRRRGRVSWALLWNTKIKREAKLFLLRLSESPFSVYISQPLTGHSNDGIKKQKQARKGFSPKQFFKILLPHSYNTSPSTAKPATLSLSLSMFQATWLLIDYIAR